MKNEIKVVGYTIPALDLIAETPIENLPGCAIRQVGHWEFNIGYSTYIHISFFKYPISNAEFPMQK